MEEREVLSMCAKKVIDAQKANKDSPVKYFMVRGDDEGPWLELLSGAKDGNMKLATQAIEQGADIDRIDQYGDTALLIACENSHEEVAEFLIEKGANIEARNNHSSTYVDSNRSSRVFELCRREAIARAREAELSPKIFCH